MIVSSNRLTVFAYRFVPGRGAYRVVFAMALATGLFATAQSKPAPNPAPDVLVLTNGDTLHGKLVESIAGKVTFHSDPLGDVSLTWDKIKELHTAEKFAVLSDEKRPHHRRGKLSFPSGTLDVTNQAVTIESDNTAVAPPIAAKHVQYIMDEATLDKELNHEPGLRDGWSGQATAGATLVTATQNQYTFSGALGLVRAVPTVSWLDPRNRTSVDFAGSFGKITQPAYTIPGPPLTVVPEVITKTAIYHADAERDEYFSTRFFALAQTSFDHNYSQSLDLQQIYGGGIGWTAIKSPRQELDLKATVQYEKQQFINATPGSNQDLIGSTFSATYNLHTKLFAYTQGVAYIPAFNTPRAYSTNETNTFAFPTYKNLSFSVGTIDSYLNDPPISLPPTKRNSFQFTMGFTYAIKPRD